MWPFLNPLFSKLELIKNKEFIDDISKQKAICLTQFLVCGNLEFQESDLVLNKILCGVPLDYFVDTNIEINDFEMELCESLLKSVLQNWSKLKNSSVKSLQESFLKREGVIKMDKENYRLIVKTKPFDMLLKSLTWGISMIQTSFMKVRLFVDWN